MLPNWNFPSEFTGTIKNPPGSVIVLTKDSEPWERLIRKVKTKNGYAESIWVKFDEPQMDGDDDGPYIEGEIELEYIKFLAACRALSFEKINNFSPE